MSAPGTVDISRLSSNVRYWGRPNLGLIPAHLRGSLPAWGAFALDGERYEQSQIQSRPDGKLHTQIYWNRQSGCRL